jgi:hypothetical protein
VFTGGDQPGPDDDLVVPRQFLNLGRLFNSTRFSLSDLTILSNKWAVARQVAFPELPAYDQVPLTGLARMKFQMWDTYISPKRVPGKCLLVGQNGLGFHIEETLDLLRAEGVSIVKQNAYVDPLFTLEAMCGFECLIGFENEHLALAAFISPASLAVQGFLLVTHFESHFFLSSFGFCLLFSFSR